MTRQAQGKFKVAMKPRAEPVSAGAATLGRMTLDKTYTGDLVATARGEMLSATTAVEGSAGYVAIEYVEGELAGRRGGFVLQHTGTMNRGEPSLRVTVVPDSGSGELAGLEGSLSIEIAGGEHLYGFDYSLP